GLALALILLIAGWLRFTGLNWDEGRHLHPDERFLSTVTNDLKWPENLDTYFDPTTSSLSPYSLPNMGLYIYGMLPVYLVKGAALLLHQENYDRITLIGRAMSAVFDLGAILLLFLIARRLHGARTGLLAAALMSVSVLNIQLSHFYAVDTFANLFILGTLYFLLRALDGGRWLDFALTGLMFGLGLASKLSVMTLAAPILVVGGLDMLRRLRGGDARLGIEQNLVRLLTLFLVAFVTFRVVQPIAFSGPGFWDLSLNPRWVADVVEQQKTASGKSDLPWVQQWTGRSAAYPLYNIVFWGMGLPLGLAAIVGFGLAAYELWRRRIAQDLLPITYVGVTFLYHALTFVKFMRYFLPIYPFLAMMAAALIIRLWREPEASGDPPAGPPARFRDRAIALLGRVRFSPALVVGVTVAVVGGTLLYAVAFSSIYSRPHTRVAASRWMYTHIPAGSTLANEHWDDWLPIGGLDGKTAYGDAGLFKSVEMKNYEDDTPQKLDQMVSNLEQADYIVLSSNRLYGSIPRLPMRYPLTSRYYELLFSGKLGFQRVAEFTSYPSLFGISLHDQAAEESFSVYDHPRVQIFKKTAAFNAGTVRAALSQGIAWNSIIHMTPWDASAAPHALTFTAQEQGLYQRAAQTSSLEVNPGSWGSRVPVLAWFLILELLGLIALPISLLAFRNLADRGYILGKPAGLLLAGWGAWLLASLRIAPFTWWVIILVMLAIVAASTLLARSHWRELRDFLRGHWQSIVLEEALFWI
ncbi:MAG TPA: glycosyltransferase family 39 protein, partial [Anaerolineales bacterium]